MRMLLVRMVRKEPVIKIIGFVSVILITAALGAALVRQTIPVKAQTTICSSSSPSSGAYRVTICLTSPSDGSILTGNAIVTATASVTGTNPGVQRMIFSLNTGYLLTDFSSPYTFTLPTNRWADGSYTLYADALMRDGFTTAQADIGVGFSNGNSIAPVNTSHFQPSTGRSPVSGQPFIVAAAGDGASGEPAATNLANLVVSLNPNLFLYLGDVYESGSIAEFYNWYGTSSNLGLLRSITDPTIGNHEYTNGVNGAGYFDYWNNIPNYYSYNSGGWHFVSLNSNSSKVSTAPQGAQYKWLQQDLAANSQTCTIVYYHEPLFNIGTEAAATNMSSIWALMAQYGVVIVLNGHDHDYQRWVPLDGTGQPSATGITEIVAGGGGHGVQTFTKTDSRVAYSNDTNPAAIGALVLQLSQSGANFSYHSTNGSILDSGFIPCVGSGSSSPTPTSTPTLKPAVTDTPTPTPTLTPTQLVTGTPTPTPTLTPTQLVTNTPTPTPTLTPTTISSQSLVFTPDADTYVDSSNPTTNYGAKTTLRVDGSPEVHSYIRFTVSGTSGRTITHVRLLLYANSSGGKGIQALAVSDNSWGELTTIYNNAPALGSLLASSAGFTSSTWVTLDVTSYITGDGTYSFGIVDPNTTAISLASRESSANAPQLIIDYQ